MLREHTLIHNIIQEFTTVQKNTQCLNAFENPSFSFLVVGKRVQVTDLGKVCNKVTAVLAEFKTMCYILLIFFKIYLMTLSAFCPYFVIISLLA